MLVTVSETMNVREGLTLWAKPLPPLEDDDDDVLFNVVHLDEQAQCANRDLLTVERRASMTLIGWRVYGALLRTLQVRETAEEIAFRTLVL